MTGSSVSARTLPGPSLQGHERPRLALGQPEPLAEIAGGGRKSHHPEKSPVEEDAKQAAHLPVDALAGLHHCAHPPVKGECVELLDPEPQHLHLFRDHLRHWRPLELDEGLLHVSR